MQEWTMIRIRILALTLKLTLPVVALGLNTTGAATAQSYPNRPVRLVVGVAAGATNDLVARLIGQYLSERLGQQFIIENHPGAGGNIAAEAVVNAPPDGYTLFHATTGNAISATLYEKLKFNFVRDLEPVSGTVLTPLVMEVHPAVSAKTVPEFIAHAKANPGKINMASAGTGTSPHVAGELFKMMAGVNLVHVPYRGSAPALTDLLAGQVQVTFDPVPASIEYIKAGRLRPLAVTTTTRSEALPDVPTVADFLPGYEASTWWGVCAPKNTPAEIVDKLNKEINAVLADPKIKARLADLGGIPLKGSPADFGKLIAADTEKWGKVVKFAGMKVD
jgi:tripartite-type tricarboxylate transporter receptor subunit TctC